MTDFCFVLFCFAGGPLLGWNITGDHLLEWNADEY